MSISPTQGGDPAAAGGDTVANFVELAQRLVTEYGLKVLAALAILVIGWMVARALTGGVRKALERAKVEATLARFLCNLVHLLAMAFVLIAAVSKLGVETASLVAVLGAAGFAIGFALQGSLSNLAAGVMILIFRPFRVGDVVESAGVTGKVQEVGIFHSVFLTPDNKRVIVANSSVTGGNITNFSAMPTRRVDLRFGISYGDDIQKAKRVMHAVLEADARVLADPAPTVAVVELGDSSVNLVCRPWVATADYWDVFFALQEAVKLAFDREDITIPFPQRDVHLDQVA